jgi:hypothetical protein
MTTAILQLELLSAATFGRGDGVAGLVDREVEHDRYGFPFLRGRTLKGLLAESAEDLVFAFKLQDVTKWAERKTVLFGRPGSDLATHGNLHVGDARLPKNLRQLMLAEMEKKTDTVLTPDQVFEALTGIRRQTAMNPFGGPDYGTLRSMRIILRGVILEAVLSFEPPPTEDDWALLAGAVLGLRSAGTGRNRGRGRLRATLNDEVMTQKYFSKL